MIGRTEKTPGRKIMKRINEDPAEPDTRGNAGKTSLPSDFSGARRSSPVTFGSKLKSAVNIESQMLHKRNNGPFGLLPVSGSDGAKPFPMVQIERTSGLPIQQFRATASASILSDFTLSFQKIQGRTSRYSQRRYIARLPVFISRPASADL